MMIELFKSILKSVLDSLFPKKCLSCGDITRFDEDFCTVCRNELYPINLEKRCKYCGREKRFCDCKRFVHRFSEVVSVYEYSGAARNAMLNYKIALREHYSDFFAKQMAKNIIEAYGDIAFDFICFVPSSPNTEIKRGFNPAELIARRLSKLLLVPLSDALFVAKETGSQHEFKNNKEQRFLNTYNKYGCSEYMKDKTVLLIDDVMTTGATLDDCTRALLFAGTKAVYCATALITVIKPKTLDK